VEVSNKVESLREIDLDGVGLQLGGGEPLGLGVRRLKAARAALVVKVGVAVVG